MNRADLLLSCLKDGQPWTRRDIFERVGFMLTNNAASELRARGVDVKHEVRDGEHVYSLEQGGGEVGGKLSAPPCSSESGAGTIPPAFPVEPIEAGTLLGSTPQLSFGDAA